MINLDIIIPVYNSAIGTEKLILGLNNLAKKDYFKLHAIFVNDGSLDRTEMALQTALNNAQFKNTYIKLAKNYGQHTATAIGFYHSQSNLVATIDDDSQHNPLDLIAMYECMQNQNADLVYGEFYDKKHHPLRNKGTKILQRILGAESEKYKMITSFRLMKNNTLGVFKSKQSKQYFIDDYLLLAASKVSSCHVNHYPRDFGKSGYSGSKLLSMAFLIFFLHSSFPLKFISRMGMSLSLVFFVLGCYYIFQKLFYDVSIGFTSLIVAIFFSTGLIMFSLGVIGEYIRQIWVSNQELDKVIIAEICTK
ncbi:MAG: glycosyltransferase [bacterium]|nr:glycosyltransferase [bacterium]